MIVTQQIGMCSKWSFKPSVEIQVIQYRLKKKVNKNAEFLLIPDITFWSARLCLAQRHICILPPLSKHQAVVVFERSSCRDISAYLMTSGKGIILIF